MVFYKTLLDFGIDVLGADKRVAFRLLHLVLDLVRDVRKILSVLLWKDDLLDARSMGSQHLLLDAAHRQDRTAQRDLTGHRQLIIDGNAGEQGDDGGQHGDAGRRAILGNGARGHMNVDIDLLFSTLVFWVASIWQHPLVSLREFTLEQPQSDRLFSWCSHRSKQLQSSLLCHGRCIWSFSHHDLLLDARDSIRPSRSSQS